MRVAICGCGVVGTGVYEILTNDHSDSIEVARVLVHDLNKQRDINIPKDILTDNIIEILNDSSIDCLVEVIGGIQPAWDLIKSFLEKGKHVVSANKELIGKKMKELTDMLNANSASIFLCEAAVCGGVPIISSLSKFQMGVNNPVKRIVGILNGTCNFILSGLHKDHSKSFSEVLINAQKNGFAEFDPSADLEGRDSRSKLMILTKLAFGIITEESDVILRPCGNVQSADFEMAKYLKCTIKYLGTAHLDSDANEITQIVMPSLVAMDSQIGQTWEENNAVTVESKYQGKVTLIGPGAGRYPTALSVCGDVMEVLRNKNLNNNNKNNKLQNDLQEQCLTTATINSPSSVFVPAVLQTESNSHITCENNKNKKFNIGKDFESSFVIRFRSQSPNSPSLELLPKCDFNFQKIDIIQQTANILFVKTESTFYSKVSAYLSSITNLNFEIFRIYE